MISWSPESLINIRITRMRLARQSDRILNKRIEFEVVRCVPQQQQSLFAMAKWLHMDYSATAWDDRKTVLSSNNNKIPHDTFHLLALNWHDRTLPTIFYIYLRVFKISLVSAWRTLWKSALECGQNAHSCNPVSEKHAFFIRKILDLFALTSIVVGVV